MRLAIKLYYYYQDNIKHKDVVTMSIRAIDTQIMLMRLPDRVWDASTEEKKAERAQEFRAHLGRTMSAKESSRVAATTEVEMENIRANFDEHGSGGGGGGAGYALARYKMSELIDPGMMVPGGENLIDIMA